MKKTGHRILALAMPGFFVMSGCAADLGVPDEAQIACIFEADCPAGWTCNRNLGKCVKTGNMDQTAPAFAGTPSVSPPVVTQGVTVRAVFDASEELAAPPEVAIDLRGTLAPLALDLEASGGTHYEFTYYATGDEPETTCQVFATMLDRGGNKTAGALVGGVMFDFAPPEIATAVVAYGPPLESPVTSVKRATTGGTISVTILATELLSTSEPPSLTASSGNTTLEFAIVPESVTAVGAVFQVEVPAGAAEGLYFPLVILTDEAGNKNFMATFSDPPIVVKNSKPGLLVDQAQVTFVRSPWGNGAEETRGGHSFPAGPYFALGPSDPLDGQPSIPASAYSFSDGTAPVLVRVWSDEQKTSLLGDAAPNGDGTWPRKRLVNLDVPAVYVNGVDDAGNESDPVGIVNVEWVATPNPPRYGKTPHGLAATGYATESRLQLWGSSQEETVGADGLGGTALSVRAEMVWRERVPSTNVGPRLVHAAAFDTIRGRMVMFGGWDGSKLLQDTLEWDGYAWSDRTPPGRKPPVRMSSALAFDSARGRTVLFGGFNGLDAYQDTWEWDGSDWAQRQIASSPPESRSGHAMAFDSGRGCVVLFGGRGGNAVLDDLWEWDGDGWTQAGRSGTWPPARSDAAMAFDSARGRIVMFGGWSENDTPLGDLWEWDGSAWSKPAAAGPGPRVYHSLVYDTGRAKSVVFGGFDGNGFLDEVWEWDGAAWTNPRSGAGPKARGAHASAYDGLRKLTVIAGGCARFGRDSDCAEAAQDTWGWDGGEWRNLTPGTERPGERFGHAMAHDGARGRTVLFGGSRNFVSGLCQDTWTWDGVAWTERTSAGTNPPARAGFGMAFDPSRGRLVLFGGCDRFDTNLLCASFLDDTWEFDGDSWVEASPGGGRPAARYAHTMAFDSVRGRVVLFGGSPETGFLDDTWEWDGKDWVERTVAGARPPARDSHAMAFDETRGRMVLFGGWDGVAFLDDLWEWDGASWQEVPKTEPWPAARGNPVLVNDSERGRTVLFGGDISAGTVQVQDTWEWDGASWSEAAGSARLPAPRAAHAAAFAVATKTLLVFGGFSENSILGDLWERVSDAGRRPAVQFDVSTEGAGFEVGDISQIRVRAYAGGAYPPFDGNFAGAALLGWATGGPGVPPGGWRTLGANTAGVSESEPYLPGADQTLVSWTSKDAGEARRFVTERDGQMSFQIRPLGATGAGTREARVAVDYVEVRVRYRAE
jgi:hypothetical protein